MYKNLEGGWLKTNYTKKQDYLKNYNDREVICDKVLITKQ